MQTSKDKEIEIKLELSGSAELAAVASLLPPAASCVTQYNLYFDDVREGWRGNGFSVRLRREDDGITLTVKTKRVDCGEFVQHDEWEAPVPVALWDRLVAGVESPARFVSALLQSKHATLPQGLRAEELKPLGLSVTKRQLHRLDNGLKVELDVTTYPDATVHHEAELEVPAHLDREAAAADLRVIFDRAGVPWRVSKVTKQSRFRAALTAGPYLSTKPLLGL